MRDGFQSFQKLEKLDIEAYLLLGRMRGDGWLDHALAVVPAKRNFLCCRTDVCRRWRGGYCLDMNPLPLSLQELRIRNCSQIIFGDLLALLNGKYGRTCTPKLRKLVLDFPQLAIRRWWNPYLSGLWPSHLRRSADHLGMLERRCGTLGIEFVVEYGKVDESDYGLWPRSYALDSEEDIDYIYYEKGPNSLGREGRASE